MSLLIGVFTFILILISLFMVMLVLMQKSSQPGLGAGIGGGGMAESAFGAETSSVLSKATINSAIAFFVISFLLFLGHIYLRSQEGRTGEELPEIPALRASETPAEAQPGVRAVPPPPAAPEAESPAAEAARP